MRSLMPFTQMVPTVRFSRIGRILAMLVVVAGLAAGFSSPAFSQSEGGQGEDENDEISPSTTVLTQGGLSYSPAIPVGEFDDALGRTAQGVDLYLGLKAGSLPLYVGVDFDLGEYGSETAGTVLGDFETTSTLYQPHLSVRYESGDGVFRPFVEGLIGAHVLRTNTTFSNELGEVDAGGSETSTAFSAGGGVGLDIRILQTESFGLLGLTGSFHYIYGSSTDVPDPGGVLVDDGTGEPEVPTVNTGTSVIQPEIGIYFEFQ